MQVARRKRAQQQETVQKVPQARPENIWSLVLPELKDSEEPDTMEVIRQIRRGLSGSTLGKVAEVYQLPQTEIYELLKISAKTGQRAKNGILDVDKSDHVVQMIKVVVRANGIFKEYDRAMTWLKSPCYSLGGEVPLSLLDTTEGIELVMDTLGRIEHGVFS